MLRLCASKDRPIDVIREERLLRGILLEALDNQLRKRKALEEQLAPEASLPFDDQIVPPDQEAVKIREKALRRARQVPQRLVEVDAAEERLKKLLGELEQQSADVAVLRRSLEEIGLAARLRTYDVDAESLNQWGRPDGFDGLVIESNQGVPILVARQSFSDALLRRIGRGKDLWFQVRDGSGSRVLLRTSLVVRLARSSRECMEMAADLAAFFSDWRHSSNAVEVMFTDSRHVAARGSRVGQMKDGKKMGVVLARPERVAEAAKKAIKEQGGSLSDENAQWVIWKRGRTP